MPNSNSAKKRVRQNAVHQLRNKARKSAVKTGMRAVRDALGAGDVEAARTAFRRASGLLDRAARKRVIHRNRANRLKSRLQQQINAAAKA